MFFIFFFSFYIFSTTSISFHCEQEKCFVSIKWTILSGRGAIYTIYTAAVESFDEMYEKAKEITKYNIFSSQWSRLFYEIMEHCRRNPFYSSEVND